MVPCLLLLHNVELYQHGSIYALRNQESEMDDVDIISLEWVHLCFINQSYLQILNLSRSIKEMDYTYNYWLPLVLCSCLLTI